MQKNHRFNLTREWKAFSAIAGASKVKFLKTGRDNVLTIATSQVLSGDDMVELAGGGSLYLLLRGNSVIICSENIFGKVLLHATMYSAYCCVYLRTNYIIITPERCDMGVNFNKVCSKTHFWELSSGKTSTIKVFFKWL